MRFAKKVSLLAVLATTAVPAGSMFHDTIGAAEVSGQQFASPADGVEKSPKSVPSPDSIILNARSFSIPFSVETAGSQPIEVQLFVSRGAQSEWQLLDRKPPTVKEFQFNSKEDGVFWFATRTMDARGHAHPAGPVKPQLKVFVDTGKPDISLEADADGEGTVEAILAVNDATPIARLKLQYVTDAARTWQPVNIDRLPASGKVTFTPKDSWQQLSLQFVATDSAGNQGVVSKLLRKPRVATSVMPRYASAPISPEMAVPTRSAQFRIDSPTSGDAGASANKVQTVSSPQRLGQSSGQPPTPKFIPASTRGNAYPSSTTQPSALGGFRGGAPLPVTRPATPGAAQQTPPQGIARTRRTPFGPPSIYNSPAFLPVQTELPQPATPEQVTNGFGLTPPAQSIDEGQLPPAVTPAPETRRPRTPAEAMRPLTQQRPAVAAESNPPAVSTNGPDANLDRYSARRLSPVIKSDISRAPVRYSDSLRFSLEYELEAVGSNGVEAVELWGSLDDGKNWSHWGKDPDRSSPFDIETNEQGVFGYRIVVVGRNGLTSPRPLAGETPDIVIVVDSTEPDVRITGAKYGEGDRIGSLVILYECEDANLMQRPIALSFSDSVDGPWTTIAAGLRNEGDYVWPADPQLPRKLFLRIDATDQAGNVGTYILDRPIDAQGLAPRARIRGFQPLGANQPESADEQTANRPGAAFK